MKEGIKLENKGLVKGSDAYNTELKTKAKLWEDRNTRVKIKNTFYEDKAKIVDRIKMVNLLLQSLLQNYLVILKILNKRFKMEKIN